MSVVQRTLLVYVCATLAAAPVRAASSTAPPHPADPYADPKNDPYNTLGYIANNTLTAIAFALLLAVALLQTWFIFKWRTRWMMYMTIGIFCYTFGISCRWALNKNPESLAWGILESLFVVLPPCAFIAAEYILLGRLAAFLHGFDHMLISPGRVTKVFVISDIVTFLIQANGASTTIGTTDKTKLQAGNDVFLTGLILQLVSFFFFIAMFVRFMYRMHRYKPRTWAKDAHKPWYNNWLSLGAALLISCIGVAIRCIYRVIEASQGARHHLATSEGFFYCLDTLPLWIAIAVYVPLWPGRFIRPEADGSVDLDTQDSAIPLDCVPDADARASREAV